jgi:predicted nucleic acid-binding protein
VQIFDTSVWAWRGNPQVDAWFRVGLLAGELAICEMVALEILSGAPNRTWYEEARALLTGVPWVHMGAGEWRRALEVHWLLEQQLGTNVRPRVKSADLLIAATAEIGELSLVHYDQDYDSIGRVTGQAMHWVAPRGSL